MTAGVGSWTATPSSRGHTVVVGPDGAVYADGSINFSLQIARSTDHGSSWESFSGPGQGASIFETRVLAVDQAGSIYAAFNSSANANVFAELSVSRDLGGNWTLLTSAANQYLDLVVDPSSAGTLFLHGGLSGAFPSGPMVNGRLWRSTDGGLHWTEIDQSLIIDVGTLRSVTSFALDARTPNRVYAATAVDPIYPSPGPAPALWVSNDSGSTWAPLAANVSGIFSALVVDPFQPSTIYGAGPAGIFRSGDGGRTFISQSTFSAQQLVADSLNAGRLFAVTAANGILATSDGGATWNTLNTGLPNLYVNALALDAAGGYLYAATSMGVFVYQLASFACPADAYTLCLKNGMFAVTADFQRTPDSPSSPASAVPLTSDTGYFWFFDPANIEMTVKVLDGCSLNGHYWVFAAGMTNVGVEWKVANNLNGTTNNYSNTVGTPFQPVQDTAAFPCP